NGQDVENSVLRRRNQAVVGDNPGESEVQLVLQRITRLGLLAISQVTQGPDRLRHTDYVGTTGLTLTLLLRDFFPNLSGAVRAEREPAQRGCGDDCCYDQFRFHAWSVAQRDAQRPPLTATSAEATACKITPEPENGKRGCCCLEQKLGGIMDRLQPVPLLKHLGLPARTPHHTCRHPR